MVDERNTITSSNREEEEQEINLYALFFKYMVYWPWFVASMLACCIGMYVFLRYQTPVYNITSSVLIKEDEKKGANAANGLAAIQDLGMLSMTSNFDNEVEILKSRTLIKKVVNDMGLYIRMEEDRTFGFNPPLYKNSPVNVFITPEEANHLVAPVELRMRYTQEGKLSVEAEYKIDKEGDEVTMEQSFDKLPAILPTPVGVFSFTQADSIPELEEGKIDLIAHIYTPTATAEAYGKDLSITPSSKTTTIAKIAFKNTVKQRGVDFVNRLVAFYNQDANDEKNEVAQKTAEFIEERIGIINGELGTTESELAAFKQRSGLTNLTSDAQMALQESSKYEQQRTENATQISLVQYLRTYINDPVNEDEVIPANVGLQDHNLTSVIDQYNTMIIERKRLLRTSSENNPAVINMNAGIEAMRRNVKTTVNSVLKGLQIVKADIDRQASKFESRISDAPRQEKEFMTISRQQEIKATLYIMLLQKREENAITLAATANNGRIIENPLPDEKPVAPKKMIFMLAALILGFAIPVGSVYLHDLLKYKIENRDDVEALTTVPILAELPLVKQGGSGAIVVRENKNDIMEETFRGLRTNLLFTLGKSDKVVLFSSTQPGEGKSFVAGNLAMSLAYLGKKVIVVGMDIRKPGLNKVFNLSSKSIGITNYLSDPDHVDLFSMIQNSNISPNLDILLGGPIPPNPTELVARDVLDQAIAQLKERYDYVILDTAPIGMVTDTAIIGRVADMCVYVCRADVTPKAGFNYINVLQKERKFPKLATVINGLDMTKRKNNYGYGYGRKYGYGKGYGYGYGYGYGFEAEMKKKK
ncbi:GumC family protein [Parabacteroides distasonis]|mgnify:FL=1|uniref:GumC family protein n=1 Tax=Parabacteroides distasonis TaxID=823 RepID=UPI002330A462|nr:tyrosine-protein kinase [Parabacteroides distasonis]MDB9029821.1 polysaccharide biosynthesis tyrosine autokinase [Parabacteroides distasonis]MDB9075623.1 polysaccharide biosynthesis tyrosine autokinase [Parabacteroides distasonis]